MGRGIYTPFDAREPGSPTEPFPPIPGYLTVAAALLSVADPETGVPNIMPLTGWGFLNRHPPMIGVAVCVRQYNADYFVRGSLRMLRATGDFCLNIADDRMRELVTESGRLSRARDPGCDKFRALGLTPGPGRRIRSPHIVECPVSYECVVRSVVPLGSHDLFLGEVLGCFTGGEILEVRIEEGDDRIVMRAEDGSLVSYCWNTLLRRDTEAVE